LNYLSFTPLHIWFVVKYNLDPFFIISPIYAGASGYSRYI